MNEQAQQAWFDNVRDVLETAYTNAEQPWQQSGVGLHTPTTAERWTAMRHVIAECVDKSGTFLDIGCANGYLLECLLGWVAERGFSIEPFGLDISDKLANMARQRLPDYADHIFVGNAWDWQPPQKFDFVRTELVYVPDELQPAFIERLLQGYVAPGGRLLLAEYRSRRTPPEQMWLDEYVISLGYQPEEVKAVTVPDQVGPVTQIVILRKDS